MHTIPCNVADHFTNIFKHVSTHLHTMIPTHRKACACNVHKTRQKRKCNVNQSKAKLNFIAIDTDRVWQKQYLLKQKYTEEETVFLCVLKPFVAFSGMKLFYKLCVCRCRCHCCCQIRSQKMNKKTTGKYNTNSIFTFAVSVSFFPFFLFCCHILFLIFHLSYFLFCVTRTGLHIMHVKHQHTFI